MTEKLDYEQLIKSILKEFAVTDTENNKNDLVDLVFSLSQVEDVCRAYPEITHVIYQIDDRTFHDIEAFFGLSESNDDFAGLRQEEKLDGLPEKKKENLNRFERHVKLSCYQREYINKLTAKAEVAAKNAQDVSEEAGKHADIAQKIMNTMSASLDKTKTDMTISIEETKAAAYNANGIAQKAQSVANSASEIADKANEAAREAQSISDHANKTANRIKGLTDQVQRKMTGIYSEFVGILAIFTALSFAMMGTVQMLGNLFNDIKHPTTGTLGYALILAGVYLIVIYLLIMTLVLAMKKLFSTISEEYRISWPFVWIISIVSTLLIVVGIFLIVLFKVSDLWTFYR